MLKPDEGVPTSLVCILSVMAGISVANLYYCQPLLNLIREEIGLTEFQVNLMPVSTQIGYACGLLFILPMGDLYNRRTTILSCFGVLIASLLTIAFANNIIVLLGASFVTGMCSVAPQIFLPFVSMFAKPKDKERMAGYILSGLLTGILGSRVISGYVGHIYDWRSMYLIAVALIALSALVLIKTFPYVEPTFKGRFGSLMKSIKQLVNDNPKSVTYSVRAGLCFGSFLGLWASMAFRMKEAPFFQGSDVVGLLGICGIAGALTASNIGRYIPRYGVERINNIGLLLIATAWTVLLFFNNSYIGIIAGIVIIDIGMQFIQLSNQSATIKLCATATSRMNTIFMVTFFIGGSIGTFLSGTMWSLAGWQGTCCSGFFLVALATCFSLFRK